MTKERIEKEMNIQTQKLKELFEQVAIEQEKYKALIITELFDSGILQQKLVGFLYRYRVPAQSKIDEDVLMEVFYYLSKYPAAKMIEAYVDEVKKNRVVGLAVCLAVRKGFGIDAKRPNYPKQNLAKWILFSSSMNCLQIQQEGYRNDKLDKKTMNSYQLDENDEQNEEIRMWNYVRKNLNADDLQRLEQQLNPATKVKKLKGQNKIDEDIKQKEFLSNCKKIITEFKNKEND